MAAPFFTTPFQPYVYQSPQDSITPFQILGGEAQVVQIMLKPEEKVVAKPGSMCFMSGSVEMENVYVPENEAGLWQWLFGKTITSVVFRNPGPSDGFVGIAAPSLARVLPMDLAMFNGEILCQPDAFLCSVSDVKVSNTFDQRGRNMVAGAEGFLRQKISGQGLAFIVAGGSGRLASADKISIKTVAFILISNPLVRSIHIFEAVLSWSFHIFFMFVVVLLLRLFIGLCLLVIQKNLEVGEMLSVDVSCIAAVTTTVDIQIKYNGQPRKAMFGGDNAVTAVLTGPGIVFIQSLPFHRLSQRIARAVTSPNMRENPKLFIQIVMFLFLAYLVILSSLILTDV